MNFEFDNLIKLNESDELYIYRFTISIGNSLHCGFSQCWMGMNRLNYLLMGTFKCFAKSQLSNHLTCLGTANMRPDKLIIFSIKNYFNKPCSLPDCPAFSACGKRKFSNLKLISQLFSFLFGQSN